MYCLQLRGLPNSDLFYITQEKQDRESASRERIYEQKKHALTLPIETAVVKNNTIKCLTRLAQQELIVKQKS